MDIAEKTSSVAVNKAIKNVKESFNKSADLVQKAMIMVVEHAMAYGDCTGAGRLVDAMPKSARRALVINHFADYSPILIRKVKDSELMNSTLGGKDANGNQKPWNLEGLKANRWDQRAEVHNEPDILTFDTAKDNVFKMLNSLEKKAANSPDSADIIAFVKKVRTATVAGDTAQAA